jgi:chitinase
MCTSIGPESGATKGECTATAGYIANAEISKIIDGGGARTYYDTDSDSDILVYGSDWVTYMTETTKARRTDLYKSVNFGVTTYWAVDLAALVPESGDGDGGGGGIALPIEEDWRTIDCKHKLATDENANEIER